MNIRNMDTPAELTVHLVKVLSDLVVAAGNECFDVASQCPLEDLDAGDVPALNLLLEQLFGVGGQPAVAATERVRQQFKKVGDLPSDVAQRIFEAARKNNGLVETAVEDESGNSDDDQSD